MHIVYAADGDEGYTVGLAASLQSVLSSLCALDPAQQPGPHEITILDYGMPAAAQARLQHMTPPSLAALHFVAVTSDDEHQFLTQGALVTSDDDRQQQAISGMRLHMPTSRYITGASWAKLLLPQLLPAAHTVLYLDADTLVTSPEALTAVWGAVPALQQQGQLLAAVRDFGIPCGHEALQALGWQPQWPYFNAGAHTQSSAAPTHIEVV